MNTTGERGVSVFHTLWIKLEASEIDINLNREIPLRWAWGSATTLSWHRGGECGWDDGTARERRGGEWREQVEEQCFWLVSPWLT